MKQNQPLTSLLILVILCGFFLTSCYKNGITGAKNNPETENALRSVLAKFAQQKPTPEMKQAVDSLLTILDCANGVIVKNGDKNIYLIPKATLDNRVQFLALSQKNDLIEADGIYDASDIASLQLFLQTNKVPLRDYITLYSLYYNPVKQWETNADGKSFYREKQKKAKGTDPKNKMDLKQQVNSAPAQDPSNVTCVDWYWVTLNPDTGEFWSATYVYTLCTDPDGVVHGSTGDEPVQIGQEVTRWMDARPTIPGNDSTGIRVFVHMKGQMGLFTLCEWDQTDIYFHPKSGWVYTELSHTNTYTNTPYAKATAGLSAAFVSPTNTSYGVSVSRDYNYGQAFGL